jgi:hypothetical protein
MCLGEEVDRKIDEFNSQASPRPSRNRDVVRQVLGHRIVPASELIDAIAVRVTLARPSIRALLQRMVRDGELFYNRDWKDYQLSK